MSNNLRRDASDLIKTYRLPVIAGNYEVASGRYIQLSSTAGIPLPSQYICGVKEVSAAVHHAREAHQEGHWRNLPREGRKSILLRWADLLEDSADSLSLMCAAQTGRSFLNFREHSLPKSISALRWFAELLDKIEDRAIVNGQQQSYISIIQREAIGCVLTILPWNDPMVTFLWKVAPSLACGNSVIVKSSEYAHHALVMAVVLGHQAGIPKAQLQLITGNGETGAALVTHPDVDAISFTGASDTGRWIASEASKHKLKRVTLECGGKSPFLVSNQSNRINEAAACLAQNAFYNQGQICSAPTRAYVHTEVFDKFLETLLEQTPAWRPSHPLDEPSAVGHMIQTDAVERVKLLISEASCRGHRAILSGPVKEPEHSVHPTIFVDVPEGDPLSRRELFGPVLIVNRVDSMQAAVARSNDTAYGLSAAIWSDDIDEAIGVASRLECGTVHVNSYGEDGNQIPFGGIKDSGQGKEKSIDTLTSYCTTKSICIKLAARA
jgi:acyl-CoA reductase-like NAD-dependent aldehyde dehydrogenase